MKIRAFCSTLIGLSLGIAVAGQTPATPAPAAAPAGNGNAATSFRGSTDVMLGVAGLFFPSQTEYGQSLSTSNSGGFAASARLHLSPWNAVEVRFTDSRNSHNFPPSWSVNAATHELTANYVATLPTDGRFQPYLLAGVGFFNFALNQTANNYTSTAASISSQDKWGLDYGGGLDIQMRDHFKVRAEFRAIEYKAPDFGATNVNDLRLDNWSMCLQPTLGLVYNF